LVAVIALIAAVAAYWGLARSGAVPPPPPIAAEPSTAAPSTTAGSTQSGGPTAAGNRTANGCLGGADPFQAVLAAQQGATPDQVGAAELALTFARWTITYPVDPAPQRVADQVLAPGYRPIARSSVDQYRQTMLTQGYTSAGSTPGAADQYRIMSGAPEVDPTHVILDMIVYRQATKATGAVETVQGFTTLLLQLVDGKWQITGTLPARGSDPAAPDPGAPWIPYVGVC